MNPLLCGHTVTIGAESPGWKGGNPMANLSSKEVGTTALYRYLRREYITKRKDIRESAVYKSGIINDNELEFIESGEEIPF